MPYLFCPSCNFGCKKVQSWTRHLLTTKHVTLEPKPKPMPIPVANPAQTLETADKCFVCKSCHYQCRKSSDFAKHCLTRKHNTNVLASAAAAAPAPAPAFAPGSAFAHASSNAPGPASNAPGPAFAHASSNAPGTAHLNEKLVLALIQDNMDFKRVLVDMHKHTNALHEQMVHACTTAAPVININNTTHKTFNLNFFLNEQCKNAMNISDFINSFQLKLHDLENVGKLGYVDGLANIILARLKEMDIYDRPIHCTDARRDVMHVKDNNIWEKDSGDEHSKIRKAVQSISKKNANLLNCWQETHPESGCISSKYNDQFMLLVVEALGGKGGKTESENKVMRQIAKQMAIGKN